MSNSSLISYTKLTSHCNKPRNKKIEKITIHHMAGYMSAKECADYFANTDRQVSSNYCIGSDGKIAMSVEECNRSWCSSSAANDNMAITIEVANSTGAPNWEVSDKAMASLINLCVDICKRNGIKKLNFTGDKNGNLTMHKYFANTNCPGPYLESKFPYIANEVNKRLSATTTTTESKPTSTQTTTSQTAFKAGDLVSISKNAVYYNGKSIPSWVLSQKWYIASVKGDRAVVDQNEKKTSSICSPINIKYLSKASATKSSTQSTSSTQTTSAPKTTYSKGSAVNLSKKPLYASSTSKTVVGRKTGKYYIYDGVKTNGRYRITNQAKYCGKTPAGLYVTGWVEL